MESNHPILLSVRYSSQLFLLWLDGFSIFLSHFSACSIHLICHLRFYFCNLGNKRKLRLKNQKVAHLLDSIRIFYRIR
jgi:hypothetical protein